MGGQLGGRGGGGHPRPHDHRPHRGQPTAGLQQGERQAPALRPVPGGRDALGRAAPLGHSRQVRRPGGGQQAPAGSAEVGGHCGERQAGRRKGRRLHRADQW
eukprot:13271674-Alexandrium_andersonii.AAC.1